MRSSPAATLFPGEKKFSVRLETIGSVLECREAEIVGPGFLTNLPVDTRLLPGQVGPLYIFFKQIVFVELMTLYRMIVYDLTFCCFQVIHSQESVEINAEEITTFVRTFVLT